MKRLILLLPLMFLVIWLAAGKSGKVKPATVASSAVVAAPAAPLSDPCDPCDPDGSLEAGCVLSGGMWNSNTCNCTYLTCDPTGILEANCFFSGGIWNPDFCHCDIPACNPSPPILTDSHYAGSWTECRNGLLFDCDGTFYTYTMFCQDGSIFYEWTEFNPVCISDFTPCGGGGGGGGGGGSDCWYDLDCWCPDHGDDPDCEEYCWWNYCAAAEVSNSN